MKRELSTIVLAAGQGKRMKSALPKVLHAVAGRPMVTYVVEAALHAGTQRVIVVVGHGREAVEACLAERFGKNVEIVLQPEQRGTGDAVRCGMQALSETTGDVAILYGDAPLITPEALTALSRAKRQGAPLSMLTSRLHPPDGYGRILRDDAGHVRGVREDRDCTAQERSIDEVNPGVYEIDAAFLRKSLTKLTSHNVQGELYLTDVVALAAAEGGVASSEWPMDELRGVNDRAELAECDAWMRARIARRHALSGVTIRDPKNTYIDADVVLGTDVVLEPGVVLRGRCVVGHGARIDVGCVLENVAIEAGARLLPYTVAKESRLGEQVRVGPFSHLRPGTDLGPQVHVGNFVETKKTHMGQGSKANHLAYLGDGQIGERVNIGAGTIFCNYDGFQKHVTILEDDVFVGSDSQLVAPVRVGKGAYVGSGTTVTEDVPDGALAVSRVRQQNREGYAAKLRAKLMPEGEK